MKCTATFWHHYIFVGNLLQQSLQVKSHEFHVKKTKKHVVTCIHAFPHTYCMLSHVYIMSSHVVIFIIHVIPCCHIYFTGIYILIGVLDGGLDETARIHTVTLSNYYIKLITVDLHFTFTNVFIQSNLNFITYNQFIQLYVY